MEEKCNMELSGNTYRLLSRHDLEEMVTLVKHLFGDDMWNFLSMEKIAVHHNIFPLGKLKEDVQEHDSLAVFSNSSQNLPVAKDVYAIYRGKDVVIKREPSNCAKAYAVYTDDVDTLKWIEDSFRFIQETSHLKK